MIELDGCYVNPNQVTHFRAIYRNKARVHVSIHVAGCEKPIAEDVEWADLEIIKSAFLPVVPAEPGYFLLSFGFDEDGLHHMEIPIVAWRVDSYYAHPITATGHDCDAEVRILCPSGMVIWPNSIRGEFDTIEEWIKEETARHQERKSPPPAAPEAA